MTQLQLIQHQTPHSACHQNQPGLLLPPLHLFLTLFPLKALYNPENPFFISRSPVKNPPNSSNFLAIFSFASHPHAHANLFRIGFNLTDSLSFPSQKSICLRLLGLMPLKQRPTASNQSGPVKRWVRNSLSATICAAGVVVAAFSALLVAQGNPKHSGKTT